VDEQHDLYQTKTAINEANRSSDTMLSTEYSSVSHEEKKGEEEEEERREKRFLL